MKSLTENGFEVTDKADKFRAMLKAKRKEKGWSFEKLGNEIGKSASYMFRLENGDRKNPSSDVLKKVCELFEVDPRTVLDMEIEGLAVNGKIIAVGDIEGLFKLVLDTDVEKMSDITTLIAHVNHLQDIYKK